MSKNIEKVIEEYRKLIKQAKDEASRGKTELKDKLLDPKQARQALESANQLFAHPPEYHYVVVDRHSIEYVITRDPDSHKITVNMPGSELVNVSPKPMQGCCCCCCY